jgi:hypothetical protein
MLFDLACKIVERQIPALRPLLRRAALFYLDGEPQQYTVTQYEPEDITFFTDNFMLPFPVTAIEDKASLIFLIDPGALEKGVRDKDDRPMGCSITRAYMEVLCPAQADPSAFRERGEPPEKTTEIVKSIRDKMYDLPEYREACTFTLGNMSIPHMWTNNLEYHGTTNMIILASPQEILFKEQTNNGRGVKPPGKMTEELLLQATLKNVGTAWQQVMFLNTPDRFILSQEPINPPKIKNKEYSRKHIPRSTERPTYTLLTVHQLRERLGEKEPQDDHNAPTPHWRRRHYRHLTADCYKNKKGKVIAIRRAWVGPTEKIVSGKRYKIRMDK